MGSQRSGIATQREAAAAATPNQLMTVRAKFCQGFKSIGEESPKLTEGITRGKTSERIQKAAAPMARTAVSAGWWLGSG